MQIHPLEVTSIDLNEKSLDYQYPLPLKSRRQLMFSEIRWPVEVFQRMSECVIIKLLAVFVNQRKTIHELLHVEVALKDNVNNH